MVLPLWQKGSKATRWRRNIQNSSSNIARGLTSHRWEMGPKLKIAEKWPRRNGRQGMVPRWTENGRATGQTGRKMAKFQLSGHLPGYISTILGLFSTVFGHFLFRAHCHLQLVSAVATLTTSFNQSCRARTSCMVCGLLPKQCLNHTPITAGTFLRKSGKTPETLSELS